MNEMALEFPSQHRVGPWVLFLWQTVLESSINKEMMTEMVPVGFPAMISKIHHHMKKQNREKWV